MEETAPEKTQESKTTVKNRKESPRTKSKTQGGEKKGDTKVYGNQPVLEK